MFWNIDRNTLLTDPTYALMPNDRLDDADLNAQELARAKGMLDYLTNKIGNDRMLELLEGDLAETTKRTGAWANESKGWKSANFKLVTPGPDAATFHRWFMQMMKEDREIDLRAGHPDHFMNHPRPSSPPQVIENFGEDNLPWYLELEFTSDQDRYPVNWNPEYPERPGAIIFSRDRVEIGSAMHEMRDTPDGMEILFTVILPDAAPDTLLEGHLRHFAVEFRNWTRMARG